MYPEIICKWHSLVNKRWNVWNMELQCLPNCLLLSACCNGRTHQATILVTAGKHITGKNNAISANSIWWICFRYLQHTKWKENHIRRIKRIWFIMYLIWIVLLILQSKCPMYMTKYCESIAIFKGFHGCDGITTWKRIPHYWPFMGGTISHM